MGLLSFFKRQADAAPPAASVSEPADAVQRARARARQRLIGAVVLVGIGIIGFPLVFETQPRPIPVDIPIDIPRKEGAPALVMPAARAPAGVGKADRPDATAAASPAVVSEGAAPRDAVITETRDEAGREPLAASRPADGFASRGLTEAPPKPVAAPAIATPAPLKLAEPKLTLAPPTDGARAKALLEGKESSVTAPRFVVQVGAFADAAGAREARLKVEKLGLKTYTQVAETAAGSRIRVRVGPFATRAEADKAQARARSVGLAAAVLTL
jgi:DedD protein